ncbi:MAG: hypothetical protein EF813_07590 [Methanosarcinales archaeon]|nr:MAG: hypothetical protein EF813_07590 [Methanosarcinales archaeon]
MSRSPPPILTDVSVSQDSGDLPYQEHSTKRATWSRHNANLYLFIFAIIVSLYDMVSTALCIDFCGPGYEANTLLRWVIHNFGVTGFIATKMCVTVIALAVVYYILANNIHFGGTSPNGFYGIYFGVIFSNIYAGTSNIYVITRNTSLYFLNLNCMQMVVVLACVPLITVLLLEIYRRC